MVGNMLTCAAELGLTKAAAGQFGILQTSFRALKWRGMPMALCF